MPQSSLDQTIRVFVDYSPISTGNNEFPLIFLEHIMCDSLEFKLLFLFFTSCFFVCLFTFFCANRARNVLEEILFASSHIVSIIGQNLYNLNLVLKIKTATILLAPCLAILLLFPGTVMKKFFYFSPIFSFLFLCCSIVSLSIPFTIRVDYSK